MPIRNGHGDQREKDNALRRRDVNLSGQAVQGQGARQARNEVTGIRLL